MGAMHVLDRSGDTKRIWDPANPDEVADARRSFDELRRKGFLAYKVVGEGDKGEQLHEFDPNAGKVILVPQMRGGS